MQKQRKIILISVSVFFLILCPLFISLIPTSRANQQINVSFGDIQSASVSDPETIQIATSDLIKNFRFEKFGNDYINPATNVLYDGRLIFEIGTWTAKKDGLNLVYKYTIGNRTYLFYTFTVSSPANIYTNCRLSDVVETSLNTITDHLLAGSYQHKNIWGLTIDSWKSYIDFTHYESGDIIQHNSEYNQFSGSLQMNFDINSGVLPATLRDGSDSYSKIFDYIGIESVIVSDVEVGNLSSTDPNIKTLTPREYRTVNRTDTVGGGALDDMHGLSNNYDPRIQLTVNSEPTVTYAEAQQHTSVGASCNPLDKKGNALWSAEQEESVKNCTFNFNIGNLSPRVEKYIGTLSFYQQKIITQEYLKSIIPWRIESRIVSSSDIAQTHTKDAAVKTTNTYMRPTFEITFDLYTCYEVSVRDSTNHTLERPTEDYEDMGWDMIAQGYGGASTFEQFWESDWVSDLLFIQTYLQALEDGTLPGSASGPGKKMGRWWKDLSVWGKLGVAIAIIVGIFVAIGVVHAIRASNQAIKRKKREGISL